MENKDRRNFLEGTLNNRELGGYKSIDGRTIKFKHILRADCITQNDIDFLIKNYNPKLDIDLRLNDDIISNKVDRPLLVCKFVYNPIPSMYQIL